MMNNYEHQISQGIEQTRKDRESVVHAHSSGEMANEQFIGTLAEQAGDPDSIKLRYARLYASLSVSIEPYDATRHVTLEMIDSFVAQLALTASVQLDQEQGTNFIESLVAARRTGLNPEKRTDQNPLEVFLVNQQTEAVVA